MSTCVHLVNAVFYTYQTGKPDFWNEHGPCVVFLLSERGSSRIVAYASHYRQKVYMNYSLSPRVLLTASDPQLFLQMKFDAAIGATERYTLCGLQFDNLQDLKAATSLIKTALNPPMTKPQPVAFPPPERSLSSFEYSSLIDNPSLPQNVTIHHGMSDKKWRVHDSTLLDLNPSISIEKLKNATKNSGLPLASIEAFIGSLYHKPLPTGDWRESSKIWFHTYYLWRQTGLATEWLLDEFSSLFVSKLPAEDACWALIDAWNDDSTHWKAEEPILACLLTKVKTSCLQQFAEISVSVPSAKNVTLLNTLYFSKDTSPSSEKTGRVGPEPKTVSSAAPGPSDFTFVVHDGTSSRQSLSVNLFALYPRWSWFRRLMDVTTCSEAQTRTAILPAGFTSNIISAILECLVSQWRTFLSETEALVLLEAAGEYGLTDFDTGKPLLEFKPLLDYCEAICFPPLTEDNQLMLLARHHRLGNEVQTDALFQQIITSGTKYSLHEIFKHLNLELCTLLMASCQVE